MDLTISIFIILFILSWLLPILIILIKSTSKGPAFFIQERSGKENIVFNCLKLRTMYVNADAHTQQATHDDARITPIGKLLRKLCLDELPQFFNVLFGDMSIIGPRPHMVYHTQSYSEKVDGYMNRLFVKPGITGLAQVMGYRGEIKNDLMIAHRIKLDIFYINKWTLLLDVKILFNTIKLVVTNK